MTKQYHFRGINGDLSSLAWLTFVLLGLVGWFFVVPIVGVVLLLGIAACLTAETPKREILDRRVSVLGVAITVVTAGCLVGVPVWIIHAFTH